MDVPFPNLNKRVPIVSKVVLGYYHPQYLFCLYLLYRHIRREINNKINKLHYRALRIVYRDEISTFEELL